MAEPIGYSLEGVNFSFPHRAPLFSQFNLRIRPGEFVAVLGPSGSGKSTFLRLLADLLPVGTGRIRRVPALSQSSFVFQDPTLLPWRSVAANVRLPLELAFPREFSQNHAVFDARVRDILQKVGMDDSRNLYPGELSGGMKMRTSLARALVTLPQVLFLDEPFAALDELHRHALQIELRKLWQKNPATIIFVTHSVTEAVFVADRAVLLSSRCPVQILADLDISSPDLRDTPFRTSDAFNRQVRQIYELQGRDA